jgi:5-(carboxyamino)imidazole ribonucleotide synthase
MKNRLGIIGGGQLGRMLAFEAKRLGFHVTVIDPTPNSPAAQVVDQHIVAGYSDTEATQKLAAQCDFLTVEIEHINTETLENLAKNGTTIHPSPKTIAMIKDKFAQKQFLQKNKIPTAEYMEISSAADIEKAGKKFGYPIVLKAKHDAFDGRGNAIIKKQKDIPTILEKFSGRQLYVEKFVKFKKELAIMVARNIKGEIATYPVVETIHQNNICHVVKAPAEISPTIQRKAEKLAKQVMQYLKGAGVFGIEMFLTKDDKILINEIAPRVHNSGHYTIEACVTNQFEQHIRAVTGLPLGKTEMLVPAAVMINILGERLGPVDVQGLQKALAIPEISVHIYGKADTKMERKMGHITATDKTVKKAHTKALKARKHLKI